MHTQHSIWSSLMMAAVLGGLTQGTQAQGPQTSWKFDFGSGAAPGAVQVTPESVYNAEKGYGFEAYKLEDETAMTTHVIAAPGGACASDKPFYFSAAVPEGNYRVTVSLGDPQQSSVTTVKAELRRLMLEQVAADPGKPETRTFIVNVRTPKIVGGGEVRLKGEREKVQEAWAWDERLTLEFNGRRPAVRTLAIEKVEVPTVYLLGDSTSCDQSREPYASWGQMFTRFFKPEIAIANHGESGESVSASIGAKRIDKILAQIKPGDYLFIQFGHNDMKEKQRDPDAPKKYKANLKKWIQAVKNKGATPVIVTSMNRHSFKDNAVVNTLQEYVMLASEAAKEENAALIDLNAMSKPLYESFGENGSIALFEHTPDGKFDATHHSPYGAYELAKCVAEGIRQNKLDLARFLVDGFQGFDPAHPDPEAGFAVPPSPLATMEKPFGN